MVLRGHLTWTSRLRAGPLVLVTACALGSCGDSVSPSPEAELVDPGLVLSEVIETPENRVVYVSLRSGTVPGGETATATNVATGVSADAPMVDGGLDPIALPAAEGDSIIVTKGEFSGVSGGTNSMKILKVQRRSA